MSSLLDDQPDAGESDRQDSEEPMEIHPCPSGIQQSEETTNEERGYCVGSNQFNHEESFQRAEEHLYFGGLPRPQYSSLSQALSFAKHGELGPAKKKKRPKSEDGEDEKKRERRRKREKSDSSDDDRKHKKRKKKEKKKKHHRDRDSRRERRVSEEENQATTSSGFLCNNEKWSFYKPSIHIDSRDFFIVWTKGDRDNFKYDKFISTERAKYELPCKDDILGADDEIRRIFGVRKRTTDGSNEIQKSKSKATKKAAVRYGPLPPTTPQHIDSFAYVNDTYTEGMVDEMDPLEKELQEMRVRRRQEPQNKAVFLEIIGLEDKLAAKRALYCSSKEKNEVMQAHKDRMLLLWKEYAVNFSKDVNAVGGYLTLLVDKETTNSAELKKEIVAFVNSRKPFFVRNIEFWRLILTTVYRKLSKSVLDYIKYIDTVLDDFAFNGEHEDFVAELILLRTRLLFESGHIPSVVATVQLLIEVTYCAPAAFGQQPLKQVRTLISQFWESGYPRTCDVYPDQMKNLFPKSERGFTQFLEQFKATKGNLAHLADSTAVAHFTNALNELVYQSTESLLQRLPQDTTEADLWSGMEEIRTRHLWFPLTSYGGVELSGLLASAEVSFSRVESTVYFFKDKSFARQLVLDILAFFGVCAPTATTNEDNVFGQFGVFEFPSVGSELENCNEWVEGTLEILAKSASADSDIFAYTLIATKLARMNDIKRFSAFIKNKSDDIKTDILTCAIVDQASNNLDVDTNSESSSYDTYAVLESLVRIIYGEVESYKPVCIDEKGAPGSIYTLRVYARLLTVCPDDDNLFKSQSMTRNHLFAAILGESNVKAVKASLKGAFGFSAISEFLKKVLNKAMKRPLTGNVLGEAATYIGFFVAVSEFVRKKRSLELFNGCVQQLRNDHPKFFNNAVFVELVMQFLWKREGIAKDLKLREDVWNLNTTFLECHPTNATLMKLMASNGSYEGKSFAMRRMFTVSHKDPFVNIVRGCASIYFSAVRAKRLGCALLDIGLEQQFTRSTLRKIVANGALCSDSSAFVRTWIRFEKLLCSRGKVVNINDFTRDVLALPFSKVILTDYVKLDPAFYIDATKLIFNERGMLGYTFNLEATALQPKCSGKFPHSWAWPSPFCKRMKPKKRIVDD